jgi:short-subunit dehydrogenase
VLAARREKALGRVADEACSHGSAGGALAVVADVTRRADVERLRDAALEAFGRIDVWVNNAGRGITRGVLELTDADVDEIIAVNLKSALYGMQAVVPHFIARGTGHLINVSSFLGRVPMATFRSVYSASKAALNSLTANLRMELRATHPGIHVSLVMPGLVATDFAQNALGGLAAPPPSPPGAGGMRPQSAEEVAEAISELIEHPAAELYTNPLLREVAKRYYADVGEFEAGMGDALTR